MSRSVEYARLKYKHRIDAICLLINSSESTADARSWASRIADECDELDAAIERLRQDCLLALYGENR